MIQFRIREWGAGEWTYLFIQGAEESQVFSVVGSPLMTSSLHVQLLSEDEEWEDFE